MQSLPDCFARRNARSARVIDSASVSLGSTCVMPAENVIDGCCGSVAIVSRNAPCIAVTARSASVKIRSIRTVRGSGYSFDETFSLEA